MIDEFITDYVKPYENLFVKDGTLPIVDGLFQALLAAGNCPSALPSQKGVFDPRALSSLSKVSLLEHTISVASNLVEILLRKSSGGDYRLLASRAAITALAHDLGKLPAYAHKGEYSGMTYFQISADVLSRLFDSRLQKPLWLDDACQAIKGRGVEIYDTNNSLAHPLWSADFKARTDELRRVRNLPVRQCGEWLDLHIYLVAKLRPVINDIRSVGNRDNFDIFSHRGTAYCLPLSLYEAARKMYWSCGAIDPAFEFDTPRVVELAKREIVRCLYEAGKLEKGFDLNADKGGCWYWVISHVYPHKRWILVPIPLDHFQIQNRYALERKKTDFLKQIKAVHPIKTGSKNAPEDAD